MMSRTAGDVKEDIVNAATAFCVACEAHWQAEKDNREADTKPLEGKLGAVEWMERTRAQVFGMHRELLVFCNELIEILDTP
jgi:predicted metal-binding protein